MAPQRKGRTPVKHHPEPAPVLDPQTPERDETKMEKVAEEDDVAFALHKIELEHSLDRDEPVDMPEDLDPAPPEGT